MLVQLEILSDPICPWCLIGKRRLERAEEAEGGTVFRKRWRPFQLNPDMPAEGMDRREYLERKFGGRDGALRVYGAIQQAAEGDGLEMRFDLIQRTPSTLDAHRLLAFADAEGRADAVMDGLAEGYFFRGDDISDRDALAEIAGVAGLDAAEIRTRLDTDEAAEAVRAADAAARRMGVEGAPTFIVDGRYAIPGAQEAETWRRVIREIRESLAPSDAATPA